MTGEKPGVEHLIVDRAAAMRAMHQTFWDSEFKACLTDSGLIEIAAKLADLRITTGCEEGPLILLVQYEEDSPYQLFKYNYKLNDSDLNIEVSFDFEDLHDSPVVTLGPDQIYWATGYTQLFGQTVTVREDGLPLFN